MKFPSKTHIAERLSKTFPLLPGKWGGFIWRTRSGRWTNRDDKERAALLGLKIMAKIST